MKIERQDGYISIVGTADEIDMLILAARMDGCWDVIEKNPNMYRVMIRRISIDLKDHVMSSLIGGYNAKAFDRLVELSRKIGEDQ